MHIACCVSAYLTSHFKVPIDKFLKAAKKHQDMEMILFASALGSLMYPMVYIRLDIAQAMREENTLMA